MRDETLTRFQVIVVAVEKYGLNGEKIRDALPLERLRSHGSKGSMA